MQSLKTTISHTGSVQDFQTLFAEVDQLKGVSRSIKHNGSKVDGALIALKQRKSDLKHRESIVREKEAQVGKIDKELRRKEADAQFKLEKQGSQIE